MQLIRHLPARFGDERRTALTIGNFDGLHRGHQVLIARAVDRAPDQRPGLLCFEPLPRTVFRPDQPVPRVTKLRDRLRVAGELGIESLAQLRFNKAFASQTPDAFVREVLVNGLRVATVIVGEDFRFGHHAAGDVTLLHRFGREYDFEVETVGQVDDDQGRISSTRLRRALADGRLDQAERLLGRRYSISGRVVHGNRLGRTLGFPTANIRVAEPPALSGVLAATVTGAGLTRHPAVVSLGKRPTVQGRDWLLEVHLFDFSGTLYGRHLNVEFTGFIRHEEHFGSVRQLAETMHRDAGRAREILDRRRA